VTLGSRTAAIGILPSRIEREVMRVFSGARWNDQVAAELERTNFGIIV
jgi:hypothetical protein